MFDFYLPPEACPRDWIEAMPWLTYYGILIFFMIDCFLFHCFFTKILNKHHTLIAILFCIEVVFLAPISIGVFIFFHEHMNKLVYFTSFSIVFLSFGLLAISGAGNNLN